MKAAVLYGANDIRIEDVPLPSLRGHEVLIEVKVCGICGSDLHAFKGKHPDYVLPIIPGHEFSGIVREVGKEVASISPGERVTVEPVKTCGKCYYCLRGNYNRCTNLKIMGAQVNGAFAEYVIVDENRVFKLPEGISFEEGAMIEPLAVAVHAIKRCSSVGGKTVAILGAGTIGLLTLQVAKVFGATKVIVSDVIDNRLKLAEELGADVVVNPFKEDLEKIVRDNTGGLGVAVAFEAVGSEDTVRQALKLVRKGGEVIIIGVFEKSFISIPIMEIVNKELTVKGSLIYNWDYELALELVNKGKVNVRRLISLSLPLSRIKEGFIRALNEKDKLVKVQIFIH